MTFQTRIDVIARELGGWGMTTAAAEALSVELVRRHPLALTEGPARMGKRLVRLGLEAERCHDVACTLVAMDLLDRGRLVSDAITEIHGLGVERPDAEGAVLDAARIRREFGTSPTPVDEFPSRRLRLLVFALAAWGGVLLAALAG